MKLFISLNHLHLTDAITCGQQIENFCDGFKIGSVLLMSHGMRAVETFKKRFPDKEILIDSRIADHEKELIQIAETAHCDWVTVLGATHPHIIKTACSHAHAQSIKVLLDLIGTPEPGQQALDAEKLGVDALLFSFIGTGNRIEITRDRWDLLRENTQLPIFVGTGITKENIDEVVRLKPDGVFIGGAVTEDSDPETAAGYFFHLLK